MVSIPAVSLCEEHPEREEYSNESWCKRKPVRNGPSRWVPCLGSWKHFLIRKRTVLFRWYNFHSATKYRMYTDNPRKSIFSQKKHFSLPQTSKKISPVRRIVAETPRNSSRNRGKGLDAKGFKNFTNRQKQNNLLWILVCILCGEDIKFAKNICSLIISIMRFIFWSVTRFFTYSAKTPLYLHLMEWGALHLLLSQPAGRGVQPGLVLESFSCFSAFFVASILSFAIHFAIFQPWKRVFFSTVSVQRDHHLHHHHHHHHYHHHHHHHHDHRRSIVVLKFSRSVHWVSKTPKTLCTRNLTENFICFFSNSLHLTPPIN